MRIALDCNSFAPHGWQAAATAASEAGLREIELPLGSHPEGWPDADDLARWRDRLADLGLSVASVHGGSCDPAWFDGQRSMLELLKRAQQLGSALMIVVAGDDRGDRAARRAITDRLRTLAEEAAQQKMIVACDVAEGLCGDSREMLQTMQEVDHPALRLCFDTGRYAALNPNSSGEVALQRVCGHLAAVRLSDVSISPGDAHEPEFPPLGQGGDVDFARTRQILEGIAFPGPCSISIRARRPPALPGCQQSLLQSLAHLRACGWGLA
jgi:sugar phosphate isomerase/epimerase